MPKPGSIRAASDVARTIIEHFSAARKDRIVKVYAADIHAATKIVQEAQDNAYRVGWSKGCDDTIGVNEFVETEDGKLFLGTSEQSPKPTALTFEMIAANVMDELRLHDENYGDEYYNNLVAAMNNAAEAMIEAAKDDMRKPGAV